MMPGKPKDTWPGAVKFSETQVHMCDPARALSLTPSRTSRLPLSFLLEPRGTSWRTSHTQEALIALVRERRSTPGTGAIRAELAISK